MKLSMNYKNCLQQRLGFRPVRLARLNNLATPKGHSTVHI